jgi:hypothetical protein
MVEVCEELGGAGWKVGKLFDFSVHSCPVFQLIGMEMDFKHTSNVSSGTRHEVKSAMFVLVITKEEL